MRVLLQVDMEGVSQITSYQEVVPIWADYWERGRALLTDDVVAAIAGLLAGGASEIIVDDQHLGRPTNVISNRLPAGAITLPSDVIYQQLRERAFDATFQVGRHAHWGTNDAFMAHTQMPGLGLKIDGRIITESHICAVRAGAPVLGITGDDKLRTQLDGVLDGTPFLAVKRSQGLTETKSRYSRKAGSRRAIRDFAKRCAQNWSTRPAPELPETFTLAAHVGSTTARKLAGSHGLTMDGNGVVSVRCDDWWKDAEPAMQAATYAAAARIIEELRDVMITSEAGIANIEPAALTRSRRLLTEWLRTPQSAWSN